MAEWSQIAKALRLIASHWIDRKSSDGSMKVSFVTEEGVYVDIPAYGSLTMNRCHTIGPFKTEDQAKSATKDLLRKEYLELVESLQEEKNPIFEIPSVLIG